MKIKLMLDIQSRPVTDNDILVYNEDFCVIGRHRSQVWLADTLCSRRHALLYEGAAGTLRVRDLNSSNGTYVNGERVEECVLRVGDEVQVGGTRLVILEFLPASPRKRRTVLLPLGTASGLRLNWQNEPTHTGEIRKRLEGILASVRPPVAA